MRSEASVALLLGLVVTAGCARMAVTPQALDYHGPTDEVRFWFALRREPLVSNHDALLGLLLMANVLDGESSAPTEPVTDPDKISDLASQVLSAEYPNLVALAGERGWLDPAAAPPPDVSARFGLIAVAACDLLGFEDSINLILLGPTERYCSRELFFRGVTQLRTPAQTLSGPEFLDVLHRIRQRTETSESAP